MKNNNISNPFIVSKSIPNEYFCDRKEETELLIKHIENGRNVVLMSPRRMGKTGLIHHLFSQDEITKKYYTFFVDIYPASTLQEMCYIFGKARRFSSIWRKPTSHALWPLTNSNKLPSSKRNEWKPLCEESYRTATTHRSSSAAAASIP